MPSNYAGTNTLHSQTVLPSDGDPAVSESVNVAIRDLMDNSVYAATQLGHKLDDRGGNYAMTGNLSLTGAGRTVTLGTEFTVLGVNPLAGYDSLVTIVAPDVNFAPGLPGGSQVVTFKGTETWLTSSDTLIGTGSSQSLTVEATTTFGSPVTCTDDVTVGNSSSDTLEVNARANFNSNVDVDGTLTVDSTFRANAASLFIGNVDVQGVLNASGDVTLGNSSGDDLEVNAASNFTADVTLSADLEANGNVSLGGGVGYTAEVHAALETFQDVTLGNGSSDDLVVNAALTSILAFRDAGRVPLKPQTFGNTDTIDANSGNLIVSFPSTSGQIYTISDASRVDGDFHFLFGVTTAVTIQMPNASTWTLGPNNPFGFVFRENGVWHRVVWATSGSVSAA